MLHSTTLRLIDAIESDYDQHRAETDRIRAELRAKSIAAHPSRVALRNEVAAENLRRRGLFVAGPSPADRVAESDARVIDLAERRGGRA